MAPTLSLADWLHVDAQMVAGTFLGIITASFIYLLSTWFAIRDRSQMYLMLMLLCLVVHIVAGSGYVNTITSTNPVIIRFLYGSALLLFYLFSTLFTVTYLELDTLRAPMCYVLYGVVVLLIFAITLTALDTLFMSGVLPYIGLGVISLILLSGINARFLRVSGSLAHIMAFAVVFIGTFSYLPMGGYAVGIPVIGRDISAVAYALCAMLFAVVTAVQFTRRQEIKEKELALSNERFQMAALGSNEGLYDWDFVSNKSYFSDRLRHIFGIPLTNKKRAVKVWFKIIHAEDRARVRKKLFAFLRAANEKTITLDFRIVRPDKRVVWVSATAVAVRDKDGKIRRLIGSVGDVTGKKRAEAYLKASEKRFRSIAEAHPVPVLIATLEEGEIVYASHGAGVALGITNDGLIGMSLDTFFQDAGLRRELMMDVEKHNEAELHECVMQRVDGLFFPAALVARLIHYERRPCAVIGINDISERKNAETKIHEQELALQQSEKLAALGGLLAGVAHELNNPLSVIVGQAVLMRESAPDEKIGQRADKIHKAGERCSRIVKSFLALARRKPPERTAVSLNEVIEGAIELLAFQVRNDNIELTRKLQADLPQVLADTDQMTQVITNLIMNAKQVLQDRGGQRHIRIESWHEKDAGSQDGKIYVAVTDNGPGVPKDLTHRIFEPFFTTKPAGAGTGVGLSLCHSVLESHGGKIWVEDAPGGGARFVFTLPESMHAFVRNNLEAITTPVHVPPQRILIVDDEVELAQTLADILQPDGHKMVLAANGRIALEALKEQDFDLILSDLRMPVLDGPGLYKELEKNMPRYLSRILFITGDTLSEPVRDFLHAYALDVIEKPYTPEDVRQAISRIVRDNASKPGKVTEKELRA
jgi:PAS domain S-box-containing protein